jgi:hypothetical protein
MLSDGKKKQGVSPFKTDKYLKLDLLFLLYKFTKKKHTCEIKRSEIDAFMQNMY